MKAYRFNHTSCTIEKIEIQTITAKTYTYKTGALKRTIKMKLNRLDECTDVSESFEVVRRYAMKYIDKEYNKAYAAAEFYRDAVQRMFVIEENDIKEKSK